MNKRNFASKTLLVLVSAALLQSTVLCSSAMATTDCTAHNACIANANLVSLACTNKATTTYDNSIRTALAAEAAANVACFKLKLPPAIAACSLVASGLCLVAEKNAMDQEDADWAVCDAAYEQQCTNCPPCKTIGG